MSARASVVDDLRPFLWVTVALASVVIGLAACAYGVQVSVAVRLGRADVVSVGSGAR